MPMVKLSRRDLMTGTMATLMSAGGFSVRGHALDIHASRPIVGAIRWDAWYDPSSVPGQAVERSLGPNKYHFRLPFFGRVIGQSRVSIDGGLQEIMDEEIHLATHAGINYWAFVGYEQGSSMDKALSLYLSSSQNNRLMFCLISELARWGSAQHVSPMIERHNRCILSWRLTNLGCSKIGAAPRDSNANWIRYELGCGHSAGEILTSLSWMRSKITPPRLRANLELTQSPPTLTHLEK
jgi:hypothetical protein